MKSCSCSCDEPVCESDIDKDDLKTVYVGIDQADSLCIKLNELIKQGKIQKDRIFYKCFIAIDFVMKGQNPLTTPSF